MRKIRQIFLLIALTVLLAISGLAQDEGEGEPGHFIWLGAGIDGYSEDTPMGVFGYGVKMADNKYIMTNMVMRSDYSTLSGVYLQVLTRQDPVTLFALGEVGVESGASVTNLSIGGGLGVEVALDKVSSKFKNFGIMGAVKILKDNESNVSNAVRPRFSGGIVYKFGGSK